MHVQWRLQHRPRACLSGGVNSKLSLYFEISRAMHGSCLCLPFNLEKMAAVLVTVFKENKVLCQGHLLRVSDVDISLLLKLQGLLSTSATSESNAGRLSPLLDSVSKAACVEGIRLHTAPANKVSLHVKPTSSSRLAHTINNVLLLFSFYYDHVYLCIHHSLLTKLGKK